MQIRVATEEDAEELLQIYRPYVEETVITFEYEVPSAEEFRQRITHTLEKYPYLIAEKEGRIVGYAYASAFKERAAYDWAVETTIYLEKGSRKKGIGRNIYNALEDALRMQHILNLNACIGYPEVEDEYLTKNSADFHAHLGYRLVGEFKQCGYKFGRWYNMVWMEKMTGEHGEKPEPVIPFHEVAAEFMRKYKDLEIG